MQQLIIPPSAIRDESSVEVIRAWIAEQGLHCSLNIGLHGADETRAWGILLADAARHVADALATSDADKLDILNQIRASLLRELDSPSSETSGGFTA